jgi:hypothetical protein
MGPVLNGSGNPGFLGDGRLYVDKNKTLSNTNPGEKFLVIKSLDEKKNLSIVSPMFIDTVVKAAANGEVVKTVKLRDGTILVQTKNVQQAKNLIKLINIAKEIPVSVEEHKTLNFSRGVVWCPDLKFSSDYEILETLKPVGVTAIYRVKKRGFQRSNNPQLIGNETKENNTQNIQPDKEVKLYTPIVSEEDSGLYFLTFNTPRPPDEIRIGYLSVKVKPYENNPMRCFKCLQFGHTKLRCKDEEEKCGNCGETAHLNGEGVEKCLNKKFCVNCKTSEHNSVDKSCPLFKQEKEIQALRAQKQISYGEAKKIFMQTNRLFDRTFAQTVKSTLTCGCKCTCATSGKPPEPTTSSNQNKLVTAKAAQINNDELVTAMAATSKVETATAPKGLKRGGKVFVESSSDDLEDDITSDTEVIVIKNRIMDIENKKNGKNLKKPKVDNGKGGGHKPY